MLIVLESNAVADEELYKDCFLTIMAELRKQNKAALEDTRITFVTLTEAIYALEATSMNQKSIGGTSYNYLTGISNGIMGRDYNLPPTPTTTAEWTAIHKADRIDASVHMAGTRGKLIYTS